MLSLTGDVAARFEAGADTGTCSPARITRRQWTKLPRVYSLKSSVNCVIGAPACAAAAHQRHMGVDKFRQNNGLAGAEVTLIT
jgi:hypothetical protein